MTKLNRMAEQGQAIWLDFIRRSFSISGELGILVEQGLRGVTSNPSIFEKAIAGSEDYAADLGELVEAGKSDNEIYEALTLNDIQLAADILRPVYDATDGQDGYVSLEVNPGLAHETDGTLREAERLFNVLDRPNAMIKIPATPEGIPAIEGAVSKGINVNVTLIFSVKHYQAAALAYIAGLENYRDNGGNIARVASVASFFVSRVDTAVDKLLDGINGGDKLVGKASIANAKIGYERYKRIFSSERWQKLANLGARVQRPLWASTSTKNPAYPDTLYVDELIGPDTVNTIPPETLEAFLHHGKIAPTLESELDQAHSHLARLEQLGIDLDAVTETLQADGVTAFARSFAGLMSSIAAKRSALQ